MTTPIAIEDLVIPASLDAPGGDAFRQVSNLRNIVLGEILGPAAGEVTPEERLPSLRDDSHEQHRIRVVHRDGRVVATSFMDWAVNRPTNVSWMQIGVLRPYRNGGIGSALFEDSEAFARTSSRPVVQVSTYHPPAQGPLIVPATGAGALPANDDTVRFMSARVFRLEQVWRKSVLGLPCDSSVINALHAQARQTSGIDYRVHTWTHRTPDRWLDNMAAIIMRTRSDVPLGNLERVEDLWDADRVRLRDDRRLATGAMLVAAAIEYLPHGQLVAYSGVTVPQRRTRPVDQGTTIVLDGHRGRRLGTLLKVSTLHELAAHSPESPFILAENAAENWPMIRINESLGFEQIASKGVWTKTVR